MDIATMSAEMASSAAAAAKVLYPIALSVAGLEIAGLVWLGKRRPKPSLRQSAMSVLMGLGYVRAAALGGLVWGWLFYWCWQHRLFDLGLNSAWEALLLFVLVDFCYYWQHRWAHATRWGWASHLQHHSVEQMNMLAPFRLSVTSAISGYQAFYAPIALIGFHPATILAAVLLNVTLQVLAHTETVRRLGVLEKVLVTPSHHRVHHASNDLYVDKNMSVIFIVWDKLFVTFQPELDEVPCVYGLREPVSPRGFWSMVGTLWFREWGRLARDVWRAPSWRARLGFLFGPPGWQPQPDAPPTALAR
jgi:sterol desaturase/sphingolipid hydroxylase (fatty acid hydroxylase superfamily)